MAGPGGLRASWEAELTADEPGRLIAWRSVPGASVDIAGSVRFDPAPGGRGTEIKVILTYAPPAGKLGAAAAALAGGGGDRLVREALRRFKQLVETGEIAEASMRRETPTPRRRTAPSGAPDHARRVLARAPDIRVDTVPDPTSSIRRMPSSA